MRYKFLLTGLCLALSGCILVDQQRATTAKSALVGYPRSQILACAGIPQQMFRDGGTEHFGYYGSSRERFNISGGDGFYNGSSS